MNRYLYIAITLLVHCCIVPHLDCLFQQCFLYRFLYLFRYGIAFRNGEEETCKAIEDAVQQLVESGKYAEIAEKYPDIVNNLLFLNND